MISIPIWLILLVGIPLLIFITYLVLMFIAFAEFGNSILTGLFGDSWKK